MPSTTRIQVEIKPVTVEDLPVIAQGNIDTLTPFHDSMEHVPHLSDRVSRQARRLSRLLSDPRVDFRKAVSKSTGQLVGVALWMFTKEGERPVNLKRRYFQNDGFGTPPPTPYREETTTQEEEEEEDWKGVDWEKWNQCWTEWDEVRQKLMHGREHWYLVPLWVLPEFEGNGIGRLLLSEKIQQCEQQPSQEQLDQDESGTETTTTTTTKKWRTTPIYLEASKQGKPLYEKLGFRQYGESYYCEMIRWGSTGNELDLERCELEKAQLLAKSGRSSF